MNETGRRKRQKGLLAFAAAVLAMAVLSITEAAAGPRCSNYTWNRSCPRYPADLSKRLAESRLKTAAREFCEKYPEMCGLSRFDALRSKKTADDVLNYRGDGISLRDGRLISLRDVIGRPPRK